jgi:hypothetical protein
LLFCYFVKWLKYNGLLVVVAGRRVKIDHRGHAENGHAGRGVSHDMSKSVFSAAASVGYGGQAAVARGRAD